ncbi:MAG: AAA family ATPase [Hyphomicrobiaceae bacterium]|nr:AAA family ATPase [Hyphomicrobiaceae bacterium]
MFFKRLRKERPAATGPEPDAAAAESPPAGADLAVAGLAGAGDGPVETASEEGDAAPAAASGLMRDGHDRVSGASAGDTVPDLRSEVETSAESGGHAVSPQPDTATAHRACSFATSADLEPSTDLPGQEQARAAVEFALAMGGHDFNVFVSAPGVGAAGSVVRTAVLDWVRAYAASRPAADEWVYAIDREPPAPLRALRFPASRGKTFVGQFNEALAEFTAIARTVLASDEHAARRRAVDEAYRIETEQALDALEARAESLNIAILKTPTGHVMAPMHDGEVVRAETFAGLPTSYREDVERRIADVERELVEILARKPGADRRRRRQHLQLDGDVARAISETVFAELLEAFADVPDAIRHIAAIETVAATGLAGMRGEISVSVNAHAPGGALVAGPFPALGLGGGDGIARDLDWLAPYRAHVPLAVEGVAAAIGAPVVDVVLPSAPELTGRMVSAGGSVRAGSGVVVAGALHRANGGYIVVDADGLGADPQAWRALKRALVSGEIRVSLPAEGSADRSASAVEPEPIELKVKIVAVGSAAARAHLERTDAEFARLFKVAAMIEDHVARTPENQEAFARLIGSIVTAHKLLPVTAEGIERLLDVAEAMSGGARRISLDLEPIADLAREADHWARAAGREAIGSGDVEEALATRIERAGAAEAAETASGAGRRRSRGDEA